jgi:hypothetical protein
MDPLARLMPRAGLAGTNPPHHRFSTMAKDKPKPKPKSKPTPDIPAPGPHARPELIDAEKNAGHRHVA